MDAQESDIETLHSLGLTVLEAKVYSTLVVPENADVKGIARSLNIAKCEVYRALSSLEKLGLVEKILSIPSEYKAIPIKEASLILLEKKTAEYSELQKKTQQLVVNFDKPNLKITWEDEKEQNIVISEGKIVVKRLVNQLCKAKKSFETISTWSVCAPMLSGFYEDFKLITNNKVKVRVLTDNLKKDSQTPQFLIDLQTSPYFEIKYTKTPLAIKMAIRDKEDVNVCISSTKNKSSPSIWSNNPIFAELATNCFENMWNKALKESKQKAITNKVNHLKK
jgi:sugar-specific transcriptional regulator TrmB